MARPDPSWRRLYRAGGIAALVYVGLVLVPVVLVLLAPVPPTDGRALLEYIAEPKVLYLTELVCFVGLAVPALVVFLLSPRGGTDLFRDELARAFRSSVRLVERARAAGVLRADFHHTDLLMLQHAARGVLRGTTPAAPISWKRFGEYMLQAFREAGGETLIPPPTRPDALVVATT